VGPRKEGTNPMVDRMVAKVQLRPGMVRGCTPHELVKYLNEQQAQVEFGILDGGGGPKDQHFTVILNEEDEDDLQDSDDGSGES
jgi:hypothetical protein